MELKIKNTSGGFGNTNFQIIFPKEIYSAIGMEEKDGLQYSLDGNLLSLEYLGYVKTVRRTSAIARIRRGGAILSSGRIPELSGFSFPYRITLISTEVVDDKLVLDLTPFKITKKGFGSLVGLKIPKSEKRTFGILKGLKFEGV